MDSKKRLFLIGAPVLVAAAAGLVSAIHITMVATRPTVEIADASACGQDIQPNYNSSPSLSLWNA